MRSLILASLTSLFLAGCGQSSDESTFSARYVPCPEDVSISSGFHDAVLVPLSPEAAVHVVIDDFMVMYKHEEVDEKHSDTIQCLYIN